MLLYLSRERDAVDGVFGAKAADAAKMEDDLSDAVLVGQWATADVDVVRTRVIQLEPYIATRVHEETRYLRERQTRLAKFTCTKSNSKSYFSALEKTCV